MQRNTLSAFADLSIIYSDDKAITDSLRQNKGGLLKTNKKNILPIVNGAYTAGDVRVTQTPQLALLHSLFFRFHNHIAKQLAIGSNRNDEQLFNECRRITIAIYQRIVYNEWLPHLLGILETKFSCELIFKNTILFLIIQVKDIV